MCLRVRRTDRGYTPRFLDRVGPVIPALTFANSSKKAWHLYDKSPPHTTPPLSPHKKIAPGRRGECIGWATLQISTQCASSSYQSLMWKRLDASPSSEMEHAGDTCREKKTSFLPQLAVCGKPSSTHRMVFCRRKPDAITCCHAKLEHCALVSHFQAPTSLWFTFSFPRRLRQ